MSEYVLQIPNDETPEAKALLRYLSDLAFVRLARRTVQTEPAFLRPTETQRQQAVENMADWLASRPPIDSEIDDVVEAIRATRQQSNAHE